MRNLFQLLLPEHDEHLTDDRLARLFCGELLLWERIAARHHLGRCLQCRLQKDALEGRRAKDVLRRFRGAYGEETSSSSARAELAQKLNLVLREAPPVAVKARRLPRLPVLEWPSMNPALVASAVFAFASLLSFSFWWQHRTPAMSSNALLVRAEHWDTRNLGLADSVVYQSVRITMTKDTKSETVSRVLYRDVTGKRRPKTVQLNPSEAQFHDALTHAGVNWNEPLSATDYQEWHDHQHVREDHIARAGSHLLRLTTTTPDGLIAEQSLTVRESDFHPVQRTVSLRDSGAVEIAEVDYKLLPWSHVDDSAFEPLHPLTVPTADRVPAVIVPFPIAAAPLSEGQKDEAELAARLVLNQLHADTGEQLDIERAARGIRVTGVVDTNERKQELQTKLHLIPHVDAEIHTVRELDANATVQAPIQSLSVASMPDEPSPLRIMLLAHGRNLADINALAQKLYSSALTISRESKDIADLQAKFGAADKSNSIVTAASLSELIYSHHERLDAALKRERSLLAEVQVNAASDAGRQAARGSDLTAAASRNLELVAELTQTSRPATRNADQILADMSSAVENLTTAVRDAYGHDQNASAAKRNP